MGNFSTKLRVLFRSPRALFGALAGAFILASLAGRLITSAASQHWILGTLLAAIFGGIAVWLAVSAASHRGFGSIQTVVIFFVLSVLLGTVVFAGISYILRAQGWASYRTPPEATFETFIRYYLWTFFDMLPVIEIWKTIPIKAPLEPIDTPAAIPVLIFKFFILGIIFDGIRRWWRSSADEDFIDMEGGRAKSTDAFLKPASSPVAESSAVELTLRNAALPDANRLAELSGTLGYPAEAEAMARRLAGILAHETHAVFVAEAAGEVVGWIHGAEQQMLEFDRRCEILGLVVGAEQRGQGVGRRLVDAVEEWARTRGLDDVSVRSNVIRPESHPFYERIGYVRVKTQHAYRKGLRDT